MLIHFGVTPYLVFDGDYLPSKAATETERAKRRDESRKVGLEMYRVGKPSQAQKELQKAVDVTPEMAGQLIRELKKLGVQYVVAPYEADAQLAYLEKIGVIQGVLSEDSDLLVFGVKCLLTKLDQYGDCIEINRKDFTACREISLVGWSDEDFRLMAILSGCDYLPSINNMGLLTAYRLVRKHKTIDKILRMLQFDGKFHVPVGYQEAFENAALTFRHQRVFCPLKKALVMVMNPDVGQDVEGLRFIGAPIEPEVAAGVAQGDLHPMTKKPLNTPGQSNIPRTPLGNVSRPNGVPFADLKQNKSIESFFKPKRTPLAELDPNSFTPSPSQQRLQQQATRSWLPSAAPRMPSTSLPSQIEQPYMTRSERNFDSREPSLPAPYQPLKRRRLCSDPTVELGVSSVSPSTESSQSRFFPSKKTVPSLPRPVTQKQKPKVADINIWSDDSIEDVMAELSDIPTNTLPVNEWVAKDDRESAQPSGIDEDSCGSPSTLLHTEHDVQEDSQISITSDTTNIPDTSVSTWATSVGSRSPSVFHSVDKHLTAELVALKASHSALPKPKIAPLRTAEGLKVIGGEYQQALSASARHQMTRQRSLTPLQRLGAKAVQRSKSWNCAVDHPKGEVGGPASRSVLTGKKTPRAQVDYQTLAVKAELPLHKGSEDMIIPNSEEESCEYSSASEVEPTEESKLDLGRFAFGG